MEGRRASMGGGTVKEDERTADQSLKASSTSTSLSGPLRFVACASSGCTTAAICSF